MLGKLIKHELRYTSRVCLPALLIMLGITVFGRLFTAVLGNFVSREAIMTLESMSVIGNAFLMAGAVWVIVILMAVRFYRNLTRDEGYLMFTLPVKPSQLIWSKLLTSYIWYFAAGVVMLLTMAISLVGTETVSEITRILAEEPISNITNAVPDYIKAEYGKYMSDFVILLVLAALSMLLMPFMSILMLYASIATGQLIFQKNRVLGAVLSYFGYNFIMQIVSSIVTVPYTISMNSMMISEDVGFFLTNYNLMLVIALLINLMFTVTFFLITNYIFTKHLNLE